MTVPRLPPRRIALRSVQFIGLLCLLLLISIVSFGLLMRTMNRDTGVADADSAATESLSAESPAPESGAAESASAGSAAAGSAAVGGEAPGSAPGAGAPDSSSLEMTTDDAQLIPIYFLALVAAVVATRVVARRDHLSWEDVGLRRAGIGGDLTLGLLTGLANFAIVPVVARSLGWATIEAAPAGGAPLGSLARALPLLSFVGAFEEVAIRGLLLVLIAAWSPALGVLITSAVFAALHMTNPGANAVAALGVFVPGVILAIARLRSGALWVPIGWHIGWNLGQGWLFGCAVSGMPGASSPVVVARFDGPALAVGGAFGPESGLIAVGSYLLTCLAYVALVRPRRTDPARADTA